jgi:hypothetical protein
MAKMFLMDQIHFNVLVPADLPRADQAAIQRTLRRKRFLVGFNKAVRQVLQRHSALRLVRFSIDR